MTLLDPLPPTRPLPTSRRHAARRQLESVVDGTARRSWRFGGKLTVSIGIGLALAGAAGAGAAVLLPSKGPVHFPSTGQVPWNQIPHFVSVSAGGKVVGYAPRADLFVPPGPLMRLSRIGAMPVPVYGDDLRTLVGHMYPGVGFVPVGSSPTSVPCKQITVSEGATTGTQACPSTLVTLPDVVGMSTPAAAAELSGMGIEVAVVNAPSQSGPFGTISAMSPESGTTVHARSIVTIKNRVSQSTFALRGP
jgi:hypothetical protein